MKISLQSMLCGLVPLLLVAAMPAQTRGVNGVNRALVTDGAGFTFPGPLTTALVPPMPLPPGVPVSFRVHTPAVGMPVMLLFKAGPTMPGAVCLPPVPYAIPACPGPCGGGTNQSRDLLAPFLGSVAGLSVARPGGGGYFLVPYTAPAAPLGLLLSVQAVITDPAAPLGYVVSNAFPVWI